MTEKELKTTYDRMSLSGERLSELEKRLDECFEREPENIPDFDEEELLHFDAEYKPSPRRRSPLKIALTSAAAVAVAAAGVTAAFRTGLIPTGTAVPEETQEAYTTESPEPKPDVTKRGITSADLPEYPNPGALDVEDNNIRIDSTTFDETCAEDIRNQNISQTVLIAEMTVTACDYEWGSGDTVYTVTVDQAYYTTMGVDPNGMSIKLLMPGRQRYQYEGCPLYAEGDRFFAALKNGGRFYEVAAAQTIADIITINDKDYAAVHSKNLPVMSSFSGEKVLTYPRTVTANPAKYYGLYYLAEFGEYYAGIAENAENPESTPSGTVDVSFLSFYSDADTLETIFEPNFFGWWVSDDTGSDFFNLYLEYTVQEDTPDIFRPMNGITCGGFSMDNNAFYMLDYTDKGKVWVVWKDEPARLYCYTGIYRHDRSDFSASYHMKDSAVVPSVTVPARIGQLGLLKILSEYDGAIESRAIENYPEYTVNSLKGTLTLAVMDVLKSGTADYAGTAWNRPDISRSEYQSLTIPQEVNWALEKTSDKFSMTLRLFNADENWRGLKTGEPSPGEMCRYFRADFTKQADGTWICSDLSPLSGDPSDMVNFYSPLTDTDIYCSYMNSGDIRPEASVEYYAVENGGLTDIYAIRTLKNVFDGVDEQDLYYRDPRTDTYKLLTYGETVGFTVEDGDSAVAASVIDGSVVVTRYRGGFAKESTYAGSGALSDSLELIPHGDFILVGFSCGSGEFYTEYYTVIERTNLFVDGCYEKRLLKITGDSIEYYHEYDDRYIEITVTDELLIRGIDAKARELWNEYEINAPDGIGDYYQLDDTYQGRVIADPELRTYDGILKQFMEVYTPEAAQEAMNEVIGHSVIISDGMAYTTEGARGADISVWNVGFSVINETLTDTTAELDYSIMYNDPETGERSETLPMDHYTINAVRTADGWRLDRFYYPY